MLDFLLGSKEKVANITQDNNTETQTINELRRQLNKAQKELNILITTIDNIRVSCIENSANSHQSQDDGCSKAEWAFHEATIVLSDHIINQIDQVLTR